MPTTTLAATTHVARDYTHLTKEALEEFAQSYNRDRVLPLNIEHDLTLPPVGKILRAWVAPLEDGEHGLFVEFDEFDQRGVISLPGGAELIVERSSSDQRPFISLHTTAPAQLDVAVDLANFATREDYQALFAALDAEVPFTRS